MSEIKIRDLYTGKPDAKDEINFEGLEEFIKTFLKKLVMVSGVTVNNIKVSY